MPSIQPIPAATASSRRRATKSCRLNHRSAPNSHPWNSAGLVEGGCFRCQRSSNRGEDRTKRKIGNPLKSGPGKGQKKVDRGRIFSTGNFRGRILNEPYPVCWGGSIFPRTQSKPGWSSSRLANHCLISLLGPSGCSLPVGTG